MTATSRYSLGDRVRVVAEGDELLGELGTVDYVYVYRVGFPGGCGVRLDADTVAMSAHFDDDELEAVDV